MALAAGTRIGPYEIVASIGAGGMGEVYKARDSRLRRDVALKVLPEMFARDRERLARFTREAQILASLNHPHIAQIYGLEEAAPTEPGGVAVQALAMELVVGRTLEQVIASQPTRALDAAKALAIARQVAEALVAAHDTGVVHRDLKPSNLVITADGTVKVLDFGLAKAREDDGPNTESPTELRSPITDVGMVLGTAAYMSPEQARGELVDKRTDVWAFGCVLYEMLTGRRPFVGRTVSDTLAAIMRDQPDWTALPAETPLIVRWLVERCLEKDARRRLHDLGDARLMLDDARLLTTSASGAAAPVVQAASRSARTWLGVAGVLVVVAGALVATGAVAVRHWREVPPRERAVQFAIVPPEGMQLGNPVQVAVSPDGESVVFSIGSGDASSLWVRPVRSLDARPLAGTTGAILPFWSPDSRSLGFFGAGKLKTVRVDNGQVAIVCDAATGRGGAWGPDDVIVFAPAADAPLQRVSATGGTPVALTKLDPPRENSHRMPRFLPDGRHFLLLVGGQGPAGGIRWMVGAGSIDQTATTPIIEADIGSSPAYSAGHLLFTRNRTLMALPFDPGTRQSTGTAFAVGNESFATTSSVSASFGASLDGLIAFRPAPDLDSRLTWIDRAGKPLGTVGDVGVYRSVALSPDDTRAAVTIDLGSPPSRDIWAVDLSDGRRTKVTIGPAGEDQPVWSPDGAAIYYHSGRTGAANIFRKSLDAASPEEHLQPSDRSQRPSDVSRDGQVLVYTQATTTGVDLWALPLTGDRIPFPIVEGPSAKWYATLSPNGRLLAYESNESGRPEIYVRPFPRGDRVVRVSTTGGSEPKWRGDGKELFYIANGTLVSVSIDGSDPVVAGPPRPLFPLTSLFAGGGVLHTYAVSQDGKRFLTMRAEGAAVQRPLTVVTNWMATAR